MKKFLKQKLKYLRFVVNAAPKNALWGLHLGCLTSTVVARIDFNHYIFQVYPALVCYESLKSYQILKFVLTVSAVIVIYTVTFNVCYDIIEKIKGGKVPQTAKDANFLFFVISFLVIFPNLTHVG